MDIIRSQSLESFFVDILKQTSCTEQTRAYVIGVLSNKRMMSIDMSGESLVLAHCEARQKHDFSLHQKIGDWSMFLGCIHPAALGENKKIVFTLAKTSYDACYRIIPSWSVYKELSIQFETIVDNVNRAYVTTCG